MANLSRKQLLEAKKRARSFNKQYQDNVSSKKPKLSHDDRNDIRKNNRIKLTWNIKQGDLVYVKYSGSDKKEICIVVKDAETLSVSKGNMYSSMKYRSGYIQVLGSSGFKYVKPTQVEVID